MNKQVSYHEAAANDSGQRVDNFIMRIKRNVPKSRLYKAIRKGEVRVNKKRVKPTTRLSEGDSIRIPPLLSSGERGICQLSEHQVIDLKQRVIYENNEYIVVNKEAGVAVHSGSGQNHGLIDKYNLIYDETIYLVHRLDKAVSGCLLLSKSREAMNKALEQWSHDQTQKVYQALVFYEQIPATRTIDQNLIDNHGRELKAVTRFEVIESFDKLLLVEIRIDTGRKHQIRKHMSGIGLHIVGDDKYGSYQKNKKFENTHGENSMMLHACKLSVHGTGVSCEAEWPQGFEKVMLTLRAK